MKHFKSLNTKKYLQQLKDLGLEKYRSEKLVNGFPPDMGFSIYKESPITRTPEQTEISRAKHYKYVKRRNELKKQREAAKPKIKPQRIKLVFGRKYEGLDYN